MYRDRETLCGDKRKVRWPDSSMYDSVSILCDSCRQLLNSAFGNEPAVYQAPANQIPDSELPEIPDFDFSSEV